MQEKFKVFQASILSQNINFTLKFFTWLELKKRDETPPPPRALKSLKNLQQVWNIVSIKIAYLRSQSETG